jgi:hypothetical protein
MRHSNHHFRRSDRVCLIAPLREDARHMIAGSLARYDIITHFA